MATAAPLLGRASSQPPKPGGSRRRREGLTAIARAEPQWWCGSLRRTNRAALRGVLRSIQVSCPFDPRRSPFALCGTRRINLYPAEESPPTKVPLATVRAQAPRRMGPIYYAAYCSHATNRSHIHLGSVCSFRSLFSNFVVSFRITLSK